MRLGLPRGESFGPIRSSGTCEVSATRSKGFPGSPRTGKDAARDFYGFLTANFRTEDEQPLNRFYDGDTMILEQNMSGTVIGEMLGIPATAARSHSASSTSSPSATASSAANRYGSTAEQSPPSSPHPEKRDIHQSDSGRSPPIVEDDDAMASLAWHTVGRTPTTRATEACRQPEAVTAEICIDDDPTTLSMKPPPGPTEPDQKPRVADTGSSARTPGPNVTVSIDVRSPSPITNWSSNGP